MAATIDKRNGRWSVRWRELDGRQRRKTCPTARSARALARDIDATQALGRDWRPSRTAQDPEISTVMTAYLNDRARVCRQTTLNSVTSALNRFVEYLRFAHPRGRLRLDLLQKSALAGFHAWLRERGACTRTANKYVQAVQGRRGFWQWAANDDRFIEVTPQPRTIDLPADSNELPLVDITWALCDQAIGHPSRYEWHSQMMALARYTGLRRKQLMGLRWSDLDLDQALLTIRPELGKSRQERRGRIVPVTLHLVRLVAGWGRRDGFLVKTKGRARTVGEGPFTRKWVESGALKPEQVRQPIHLFRKAFVRELLRRRVDLQVVQALVGHSRGVTGDVYAEAASMMPLMREAVAAITPIGAETATPLRPERAHRIP